MEMVYYEKLLTDDDIPIHYKSTPSVINQYLELLKIDSRYKSYISDIVSVASTGNIKGMRGEMNCRLTTRCAGAIYMLKRQKDLDFTKNDIADKCDISKSTFIKYYKFLIRNKLKRELRHVFDKYYMIIPSENKKKNIKRRCRKALLCKVVDDDIWLVIRNYLL